MHLFLSPHFDDAIYSCGGTIHQLTTAGEAVRIITVMGGEPSDPLPDTPIVKDLHERWGAGPTPVIARREEDKTAADIVGAEAQYIDIPDCVYRTDEQGNALYPDENSLWNHVHPQDPALIQMNSGMNLSRGLTHLYAPLAVGGHVDHLLVRDIALNMHHVFNVMLKQMHQQDTGVRIFLYEDYPYAENEEAVRRALAQLENVGLQLHAIKLTEANIAAKINGVKAYKSQISTFWENETALETRVRAALLKKSNMPVEIYHEITD